MSEPIFTLRIERGAPFYAHVWPLLSRTGEPVRDPTGVEPRCVIRPWAGAVTGVQLATSVVMLPDLPEYGNVPVVGGQIDALSPETTAALPDLDAYVWALSVDGDPVVSGLVAMEWATTRSTS